MKKTHFKIGLLTACLISISSGASAQSCGVEACASGGCKCSKKHCDDKGLLDVINNAASNFEGRLANLIPDCEKPCPKSAGAKSHCSCPKCSATSEFAVQYNEVVPVAQSDVAHSSAHPPVPRVVVPPNPIDSVPAPHPKVREVVPVPDSRNNPFGDDPIPTTRNLRPVPSRPASYLRSSNRIEVEYDPQASNQQVMRSILIAKAASKSISDSSNGLAKTSSTRRVQPLSNDASLQVEPSFFELMPPEVVPASLSMPVSSLRNRTTMPPAADQFVNPLRAPQ